MPPVPKPPTAKSDRNRTLIIALAVAAVVVAALIAASVLISGGDDGDSAATTAATATTATGTTPGVTVDPALALVAGIPQHGTVLGRSGPTVRLLQFEDLQCPICKRYTDDAFPAVVNEYVRTGRIKVDFRGLAFLGPDSLKALKIAIAAGLQNKLWQVVGLFYENQGAENSGWVTDDLIAMLTTSVPGLHSKQVAADQQSAAVDAEIAKAQAHAAHVRGTPAFEIGHTGNALRSLEVSSLEPGQFRDAVDAVLAG